MDNKTTIACKKIPLGLISYQEVIVVEDEQSYLSNLNVIFGRKIIKKIRFEPGEKPYIKDIGKEIAVQFLKKRLYAEKEKKASEEKKYKKVNHEAVNEAARDLFSQLGL